MVRRADYSLTVIANASILRELLTTDHEHMRPLSMKTLHVPIALAIAALDLVSCGRFPQESGSSPVQRNRPGPAPEMRAEGEDLAMLSGNWQGELEYPHELVLLFHLWRAPQAAVIRDRTGGRDRN